MKAIVYARQSSGDNDNSESVELQIEKCKRYAVEHGYTVVDIQFDNNTSGKTYPNTAEAVAFSQGDNIYQKWLAESANKSVRKIYREGLANVIKQLETVDAVIVYDSTRLMRPLQNSFLALFIKQRFIANNVVLDTVNRGIINYNVFTDNLVENTVSDINNEQIEVQKRKSIEALHKLKNDGRLASGSVAWGFRSDYHGGVTVDESVIPHVKYIFNAVANGVKYIDITRYLLKNCGKKWSYNEIKACVNRLSYSGKQRNVNAEIIDSKVFPCIIPFSLQVKAMDRVNIKRQTRHDRENIHPFSGLVYCPICGEKMVLGRVNPLKCFTTEYGWNYKCEKGYIYSGKRCKGVNIRESYSTENYNGLVESLLPFIYKYLIEEIKPKTDISERIAVIDSNIANIDKLESMLMNQVIKGNMSQTDFDTKFSEFAEKKNELKKEKMLLQASNTNDIDNAVNLANMIMETNTIPLQEYKNIVPYVFNKIIPYEEYVEVYLVGNEKPIKIERVHKQYTRGLPQYKTTVKDGKVYFYYEYKSCFLYGDMTENILYEDDNILIGTWGSNSDEVKKEYEKIRRKQRLRHKYEQSKAKKIA